MKLSLRQRRAGVGLAMLITGTALMADGTRFSDFTPLNASATVVPVAQEGTPITFGNPDFEQRSLANRSAQPAANVPTSGSWDMNTVKRRAWVNMQHPASGNDRTIEITIPE